MPGVVHWIAMHPKIRQEVNSYLLPESGTLIDPMLPPDGIESFEQDPPRRIVLTNRHHLRDSERFVEAFGCSIHCHEAGLHEFEDGPDVQGYSWGDELAPGVTALEVGAICDEETALRIDILDGILSVADGVIRYGGKLRFVPEQYLGDDADRIKGAIREAYGRLLDEPFDSLLVAHGDPAIGGGKEELRRFVEHGPE